MDWIKPKSQMESSLSHSLLRKEQQPTQLVLFSMLSFPQLFARVSSSSSSLLRASARVSARTQRLSSSLHAPLSRGLLASTPARFLHSSRSALLAEESSSSSSSEVPAAQQQQQGDVVADASYFADENKVYPLNEGGFNVVLPRPAESMNVAIQSPLGHGPNAKANHRAKIFYRNKLPGQNYKVIGCRV